MELAPTLFDSQPAAAPKPVDLEVVAARIASSATHVEHPNRTSEAAEDQGWGPPTLPETPLEEPSKGRRRLELPGRNGRRNPGTQALTPAEAQRGMTSDQIDRQYDKNKAGAAAVRVALQAAAKKRV